MRRIALLLGFLFLVHYPASGQVTQQFTGTISIGGNSGGPGFFGTPDGTAVSGTFTVDTATLGTPVNSGTGGNEWSQTLPNGIPANNSDSIAASSSNGSISVSNLQSVIIGETYRADLQYGGAPLTQNINYGGLAILCLNGSPNLPVDLTAFPLVIPPGCTASINFSYNLNQYFISIDLTTLGGAAAPIPQLIDPVSSGFVIKYSGGGIVNTDTDFLSSGGTAVVGAAADGITQVLLRIPTSQAGQQYTLTLLDETGASAPVAANGGFFTLGANSAAATNSLPVTSIPTSHGPMAFAIFAGPTDFARSSADYLSTTRYLSLQISTAGTTPSSTPILLVRPPVFLIHGLWGDPSNWLTFRGITSNPIFFGSLGSGVGYADYSRLASDITSTTPSYSFDIPLIGSIPYTPLPIRMNTLGFEANSDSVRNDLKLAIANYANSLNVASTQADVIGHSMGGDMAKSVGLSRGFITSSPYGTGFVHKLITIGTPHLGAQLASELLSGESNCSRTILALTGQYSFQSVFLGESAELTGAVYDLEGKGDGTTLSAALKTLHSSPMPFPMAYVATTSDIANWGALNADGSISHYIHANCPSDVIANDLTSTGWATIFMPDSSDSVVSLNSQRNGDISASQVVSSSIIHSEGLEALDFTGPAELNHASTIDDAVVTLINQPTAGGNFHQKGSPQ